MSHSSPRRTLCLLFTSLTRVSRGKRHTLLEGFLRTVLFGALTFITGCTVGPDYTPLEVELPDGWKQSELPNPDALHEYWKSLNDPLLDELLELGVANNHSLKGALLQIEEALALYGVSRAQYFPDIDLQSGVYKRRRSEGVASAIQNPNNNFLSLGGALAWEIDLFGRIRRINESSHASLQAVEESYFGALVTLQAEIANSYIRYLATKSAANLTRENIQRQEESLSLAKDRFEAGIAPELDIRQAESNLGETRAALPLIRKSQIVEVHNLAVLTGKYPDDIRIILESAPDTLPEVPTLERNSLPLDILRQRPDLRAAERSLAAQHAQIGIAQAELYPIISLPGFFSFEALNTLEDAFLGSSLAYSIGPRVDLNFLDFGRVRRGIHAQEARTDRVESLYRQAVVNAVREVEDAIVTLQEERKRADYLRDSVEASRRSTELVKSLYLSGLTDFQNVLDSERTLFSQQISFTESIGTKIQAFISLFRALGGGWQPEETE